MSDRWRRQEENLAIPSLLLPKRQEEYARDREKRRIKAVEWIVEKEAKKVGE